MWKLSAVYLFVVTGMYGVGFWVADLVKKLLVTTGGMDAFTNLGIKSGLAVGLVCVPVFTLTGIAMVLNASSSDRHQERRFHVAIPAFLGAAGLVGFALLQCSRTVLGDASARPWSPRCTCACSRTCAYQLHW